DDERDEMTYRVATASERRNERIDGPTNGRASATPARAARRRVDLGGEMVRRYAVARRRKGDLRVARLGCTPAPAWDGRASPGARQRLHHRMRCGQRDVHPPVLRRARRLPHLRD